MCEIEYLGYMNMVHWNIILKVAGILGDGLLISKTPRNQISISERPRFKEQKVSSANDHLCEPVMTCIMKVTCHRAVNWCVVWWLWVSTDQSDGKIHIHSRTCLSRDTPMRGHPVIRGCFLGTLSYLSHEGTCNERTPYHVGTLLWHFECSLERQVLLSVWFSVILIGPGMWWVCTGCQPGRRSHGDTCMAEDRYKRAIIPPLTTATITGWTVNDRS